MKTQFSKYLPAFVASLAVVWGLQAEDRKSTANAAQGCMDLCYGGPNLKCDDNWEFMAGAVYEQVRVQGAEVAMLSDAAARGAALAVPSAGFGSGQVAYPTNASGVQQPEDFAWGFKIGAGYRNMVEGWRSAVRYNYFKAITNSSIQAAYNFGFAPSQFINRGLFTVFSTAPGSFTTSATGSVPLPYTVGTGLSPQNPNYTNVIFQNLQLGNSTIVNNLNFTLERPSLVTSHLEMTPFYGVSTTILTRRQIQVFTNDYSPTTASFGASVFSGYYGSNYGCFYQNYQKYTWWGVGPLLGVHTSWMLGYDFSVYGDAYGALTYGQCSTRASTFSKRTRVSAGAAGFSTNDYVPVEAVLEQRMFQFSPEANFNLGIRWEQTFSDESMRARVQIGYESAYYFLVMKTIVNDMAYRVEDGAGLGLQGLVIEGRLEF
jgi:hypothetical protein